MSATVVELLASAAQTADGNGASIPIQTLTMAQVECDITAASGTIDFTLTVQGSSNGQDWYPLIFANAVEHVDTAAGSSPTSGVRDLVDGRTSTAAAKYVGFINHLPAKYVRARWYLSGTTPSVTFSVKLVGK